MNDSPTKVISRRSSCPSVFSRTGSLIVGSHEYRQAEMLRRSQLESLTKNKKEQEIMMDMWRKQNDLNNLMDEVTATRATSSSLLTNFFKSSPKEKLKGHIETTFKAWDTNNNGVLDKMELLEALKEAGKMPTEEELQELFDLYDENHDECFDLKEFDAMVRVAMGIKSLDSCREEVIQRRNSLTPEIPEVSTPRTGSAQKPTRTASVQKQQPTRTASAQEKQPPRRKSMPDYNKMMAKLDPQEEEVDKRG